MADKQERLRQSYVLSTIIISSMMFIIRNHGRYSSFAFVFGQCPEIYILHMKYCIIV